MKSPVDRDSMRYGLAGLESASNGPPATLIPGIDIEYAAAAGEFTFRPGLEFEFGKQNERRKASILLISLA